MPNPQFSENQLFYASLYALASLPGGKALTDEICEKYGQDSPGFLDDIQDSPTSLAHADQHRIFFDALYQYLANGGAPDDPVFDTTPDGILVAKSASADIKMISISKTGGWNNNRNQRRADQRPMGSFFSPALEYAVNKSGLDRKSVKQSILSVDMFDNGKTTILKPYEDLPTELTYPGQAESKYRFKNITEQDLQGVEEITCLVRYRTVAVKNHEDACKVWVAAAGRCELPVCENEDLAMIAKWDLAEGEEDIMAPSDDDILKATGSVVSNGFDSKENYAPGLCPRFNDRVIVKTNKENVILYLKKPEFKIEVTEHLQIGNTHSCLFAKPGDVILAKKTDSGFVQTRLVRKDTLERGIIEFRAKRSYDRALKNAHKM